MALSNDRELNFYTSQELIEIPMDDNVTIYKGAFVGRNRSTGYARALVAGDEFLGIAYRRAANTAAGHAAGAVSVVLHQQVDVVHALTSAAVADIGKVVYASDDSTLSFTPTGNSRVGRVASIEGTDTVRARLQPTTSAKGNAENLPITTLSDASATLTLDHVNRVLLMGNTAARTLTLPPAATVRAGGWIRVVKTTAAAFAITLDGSGAETIDGGATLATIDAQYDVALLLCTGTEWVVLSRDIA